MAERIDVPRAKERLDGGEDVFFVDTRNPQAWAEAETKLPGAIRVPADQVEPHLADIPRDRAIVTYCTWPNEASSARVAETLEEHGFKNVYALIGGFDAWKDAGMPLEPKWCTTFLPGAARRQAPPAFSRRDHELWEGREFLWCLFVLLLW
jgi:rhodanese-related sulfurtransferase